MALGSLYPRQFLADRSEPGKKIKLMEENCLLQKDILSLMAQLQKLLKVIHHSDPTAEELKHVLYQKYRSHLASSAARLRRRFHWNEFQRFFTMVTTDTDGLFSLESRDIIVRKLLKDFEAEFVNRLQLNELKPPDPKELKRQIRSRQILKEVRAMRSAEAEKPYDREMIMDMVQATQRRRKARSDLQKIVAAFKKVDPEKLEIKINQSLKPDGKP